MASLIPKFVKKEIIDVWVAESWKLMLLNSSHEPNASTQQYIDDVNENEIADGGGIYTAGGVPIADKIAVADGNDYYLDARNKIIGPGSTISFRYGVLFKDVDGNPARSPIRAHIDFITDQTVTNGTCTIQWNALGIIYIS